MLLIHLILAAVTFFLAYVYWRARTNYTSGSGDRKLNGVISWFWLVSGFFNLAAAVLYLLG